MSLWQSLTADDVHKHLDAGAEFLDWFRKGKEFVGEPRVKLPNAVDADVLLERLGVSRADRVATLASRPDPDDTSALWWLLERSYSELVSDIGGGAMLLPDLPLELGQLGRHIYVWLFLAAIPSVREYHTSRGIPENISWASLGDLGLQMNAYRRIYGTSGLHTQTWLTLTFRGGLYILGRLQFDRTTIPADFPPGPDGVAGPHRGKGAVSVHIPAHGVLDFDECNQSMARASEFFPRHFPDQPVHYMLALLGWMLDKQLTDYLPPESNLLRFQRRFNIVPAEKQEEPMAGWTGGDRAMLKFVFNRTVGSADPSQLLDELPQETTLQRAFVTHVRSGKHWYQRTGWYPLGDAIRG